MKTVNTNFDKKRRNDSIGKGVIFALSLSALVFLLLIFTFILREAFPAYKQYGFWHMYTTATFTIGGGWGVWGPLTVTIIISILALLVSAPIGFRTAVFLKYRVNSKIRKPLTLIINILAGVPSIIFGIFATGWLFEFTTALPGVDSGRFTIANGTVMLAIMLQPTIISMILNQLDTVNKNLLPSTQALGNTKTAGIYQVVKKEIRSGIWVANITALGRAIGETMALGLILLHANVPDNPLSEGFLDFLNQGFYTLGVQIAKLMFGDNVDDTSHLFAAGIALFVIIIMLVSVMTKLSKKRKFGNDLPWLHKITRERAGHEFAYYIALGIFFGIIFPFKFIGWITNITINRFTEAWKAFIFFIMIPINKVIYPEFTGNYNKYFHEVSKSKLTRWDEYIRIALEWLSTFIVFFFIFWILNSILIRGIGFWEADHWKFKVLNESGSRYNPSLILHPMISTFILVGITIIIAIPFALGTALYLSEYGRNNKTARTLRLFLDSLGGTPSIVFGIFGSVFFIQTLGLKTGNSSYSLLAGALTMAIVIIPTFTRSVEQVLVRVPDSLRNASYAVGASKLRTIFKVVIPQSFSGIMTGIILSAGRIVSETAPVFLTFGFAASTPDIGLLTGGHTITTAILSIFWNAGNTPISETLNLASAVGAAALIVTISLILLAESIGPISKKVKKMQQQRSFKKIKGVANA